MTVTAVPSTVHVTVLPRMGKGVRVVEPLAGTEAVVASGVLWSIDCFWLRDGDGTSTILG